MLTFFKTLTNGSAPPQGYCYAGNPPDRETLGLIRAGAAQGRYKPHPHTPLSVQRFVILDTETTGFDVDSDEVISVGAVVIEGGRLRHDQCFDRLVNPFRPIPPEVTGLTGITPEMVASQPGIFPVLKDFFPYLGNSVIIGHSISFDLAFLNHKLQAYCRTQLVNPALDTWAISRALYPELPSHSLDHLLEHHGIEPHWRHTALGDALLTAQLFLSLLSILKRRRIDSLRALNRLLNSQLRQHVHLRILGL